MPIKKSRPSLLLEEGKVAAEGVLVEGDGGELRRLRHHRAHRTAQPRLEMFIHRHFRILLFVLVVSIESSADASFVYFDGVP